MGTSNTEDVDFYNPHSLLKREPGIYLDQLERVHAEETRAVMEDREPDYENLPATAGTPLATRAELPAVRVGTAPEVFSTLEVATDASGEPEPGTEEHNELAYEANKQTLEDIAEARKERIDRESAASVKAAENHATQEKANVDAAVASSVNPSRATAQENSQEEDK